MRSLFRLRVSAFLCLGLAALLAQSAPAAEQVRPFLEKLREHGYYDVAVEYLEEMKDSPLAPEDFRENFLYERGTLLVEYARMTQDSKLREELFEQARKTLDEYAQGNAGTQAAAKAYIELGNVLVERGRNQVRRANAPANSGKKKEIMAEARKHFDEATKVFGASEDFYRNELKDSTKFPKNIDERAEPEKFKLRNDYRAQFVQCGLLIATVTYEKAKTYEAGSEDFKKTLTAAADAFGKLEENYRTWLAGLYAQLYRGRCLQDLRDYKNALSTFEDLAEQPAEDPALRALLAKTHVQIAECLIAQAEDTGTPSAGKTDPTKTPEGQAGNGKPEKYDELIAKNLEWLNTARGAEQGNEDFITLRYYIGLAFERRAATLIDPTQRALQKQGMQEARKHYKIVANSKNAGEFKKPAQEGLARIKGDEEGEIKPETFTEALDAAKEMVTTMEGLKQLAATIPKDNPAELKKTKEEIDANRQLAADMLNTALSMVDDKTSIDDVNFARYYLCYLYYDMGRFYDAAVLGEFMARSYSDSAGARPGAKIAMASYLISYNDPQNKDKDWDADQVINVAEFITRRWPDGDEADEAYNMLVNFSVQRGKADDAVAYLEKISAESKDRGKAELKVGQELWKKYSKEARVEEANRQPAAKLNAIKQLAQTTLEKGVARMQKEGTVNSTMASAVLSLAQIYLDQSKFAEGVKLLEDEKFGPLTLVKANHEAATFEGFPEAVYTVALRAYVTMKPPRLDDATAAMDALEAKVRESGDAGAAEKMTQILISLGRQLQDMLAITENEEDKQAIASSFEVFLDRISKAEQGQTWASRVWVARTYFDLGMGLQGGKKAASKKAKEYFGKSVAAYDTILKEVAAKKLEPPTENSTLGVQMQMAEAERKMGNYGDALSRLAKIVTDKPAMLDAQILAAYTYQERGVEDPKWYRSAYMGGSKKDNARKNIWGWHQISERVRSNQKFYLVFHEARYNLAHCRFEYAKSLKGEERKKYLEYAEKDVVQVYKLYPDLGDDEWKTKYASLLKEIQRSLGKPAAGLKAVDDELESLKKKAKANEKATASAKP